MEDLVFIHQANYTTYMIQSDDLTHNNTPDDQDEDQVDGAEVNEDLDKIHNDAFGDEDNLPIDKEINKDEISRIKDLNS